MNTDPDALVVATKDGFSGDGLTKREEFAKAAMQGVLAHRGAHGHTVKEVAQIAVAAADELIKELNAP